jgi:hypothetical protein
MVHAHPFSPYYHHVQSCSVRSVGRYTPSISSLPCLYSVETTDSATEMQKCITETQTFRVNCTSLAGCDDPGDEGAVAQPVLQGLLVGPVGPLLDLLEVGVGLAQASVEDRHLMQ